MFTCDGKPPSILGTTFAVNLPRDIRLETAKIEPVLTLPSDLETLKFGDVFSQQNGRSELATHSCNSGFTPRPSRDHVKHVLETGCFETIIIVPFGTQQVHSVMLPTHCQSFTTERKERPCQAVFGPESMNGRGSSGQQPFMSGTVFTHTLFKGLCVFWMHFIRVWVLWHHHVFFI